MFLTGSAAEVTRSARSSATSATIALRPVRSTASTFSTARRSCARAASGNRMISNHERLGDRADHPSSRYRWTEAIAIAPARHLSARQNKLKSSITWLHGFNVVAAKRSTAKTAPSSILLFACTFSFFLHLCGGIRHLVWDAGYGFELRTIYASGWTVVMPFTTTRVHRASAFASRPSPGDPQRLPGGGENFELSDPVRDRAGPPGRSRRSAEGLNSRA